MLLLADGGSHAYHFTHHACGAHHTYRSQGYMSYTDVAACHKEVVDVTRIEATIRHSIEMDDMMLGDCLESISREFLLVVWILPMQIDAPGGSEGGIFVPHILVDIILLQDIVTHQTA